LQNLGFFLRPLARSSTGFICERYQFADRRRNRRNSSTVSVPELSSRSPCAIRPAGIFDRRLAVEHLCTPFACRRGTRLRSGDPVNGHYRAGSDPRLIRLLIFISVSFSRMHAKHAHARRIVWVSCISHPCLNGQTTTVL